MFFFPFNIEINPDFRAQLEELVPSLLAPSKLVLKKVNGQELTASLFVDYFVRMVKLFNGDKLPPLKNVFEVNAINEYYE